MKKMSYIIILLLLSVGVSAFVVQVEPLGIGSFDSLLVGGNHVDYVGVDVPIVQIKAQDYAGNPLLVGKDYSGRTNFILQSDGDIFLGTNRNDISEYGANTVLKSNGNIVFNQNLQSVNFRVGGLNQNGLLFADGAVNKVGIGTTAPTQKLQVVGNVDAQDYLINGQSVNARLVALEKQFKLCGCVNELLIK